VDFNFMKSEDEYFSLGAFALGFLLAVPFGYFFLFVILESIAPLKDALWGPEVVGVAPFASHANENAGKLVWGVLNVGAGLAFAFVLKRNYKSTSLALGFAVGCVAVSIAYALAI
jgi:hypothetical protein